MASLVFPLHDPSGYLTDLLFQILPTLKENFNKIFVSITPKTSANKEVVRKLSTEPYFVLNFNNEESPIKEHYLAGYKQAVENSSPQETLILGDVDRLAFMLLGKYGKDFLEDIKQVHSDDTPLVFSRSVDAWKTHPLNYRALELMVSELSENLFGEEVRLHLVLFCPYGCRA